MSLARSLRQIATATLMLLKEATRELGLVLGFSILFPIGILFFLDVQVPATDRVQVLVGTIMMEMSLLNVNALAQSMGQDKDTKIFDLWVSLPVSPVVYTVSTALSFLPFSLASAFVTLIVASTAFGISLPLTLIPLLIAGLLLVWLSTLGIGFLIGAYGRTPRQINTYAQLVGILLTFFAPVFYPVTFLPPELQVVAYLWPLTWGSVFLVGILNGVELTVLRAGAVLAGFVVFWFILIARGVRWRQA
jgi:ABC-2 type transport system permease protein